MYVQRTTEKLTASTLWHRRRPPELSTDFFFCRRYIRSNPRVIAQLKAVGCCCRLLLLCRMKRPTDLLNLIILPLNTNEKYENCCRWKWTTTTTRRRFWLDMTARKHGRMNWKFISIFHFVGHISALNNIFYCRNFASSPRRLLAIHNLSKLIKFSSSFGFSSANNKKNCVLAVVLALRIDRKRLIWRHKKA